MGTKKRWSSSSITAAMSLSKFLIQPVSMAAAVFAANRRDGSTPFFAEIQPDYVTIFNPTASKINLAYMDAKIYYVSGGRDEQEIMPFREFNYPAHETNPINFDVYSTPDETFVITDNDDYEEPGYGGPGLAGRFHDQRVTKIELRLYEEVVDVFVPQRAQELGYSSGKLFRKKNVCAGDVDGDISQWYWVADDGSSTKFSNDFCTDGPYLPDQGTFYRANELKTEMRILRKVLHRAEDKYDDFTRTTIAGDFFISKVKEGSGKDKYVQIYNQDPHRFDLSNGRGRGSRGFSTYAYYLLLFTNGNGQDLDGLQTDTAEWERITKKRIFGQVDGNEVFTICHTDYSKPQACNEFDTDTMEFNGNDSLVLVRTEYSGKKNKAVEIVDYFGDANASYLELCGVKGQLKNSIVIRRPDVCQGNPHPGSSFKKERCEWAVEDTSVEDPSDEVLPIWRFPNFCGTFRWDPDY